MSYAVIGFVMLIFFRRTPQSRLPKWAGAFYIIPVMILLLIGALGSLVQFDPTATKEWNKALTEERMSIQASIETQQQAYGAGFYFDAVGQSFRDLTMNWQHMPLIGWSILGLFLLGAWFVRSGAIANPLLYRRLYSMLRWGALPAGVGMMMWSFWLMPTMDFYQMDIRFGFANALSITGSGLMSLGYMAWIIRGLDSKTWAPRLKILAPAGRMALTNYLTQSLICVLIFYNFGLGFYEELPRAWQIPFVILLFSMQVAASRWWLSRFRFGPVEWLWRGLTYLKFPRIRNSVQ